jgi:hypothetical protein
MGSCLGCGVACTPSLSTQPAIQARCRPPIVIKCKPLSSLTPTWLNVEYNTRHAYGTGNHHQCPLMPVLSNQAVNCATKARHPPGFRQRCPHFPQLFLVPSRPPLGHMHWPPWQVEPVYEVCDITLHVALCHT